MIFCEGAMAVNVEYAQSSVSSAGVAFLKRKKGSVVYHSIRRAILLGELEPARQLTEQHIAGELGCSQGTVREALLRLQQDGLVSRRGYQGTQVSDTSPAEAAQMASIRISIETAGVRRSAGSFRKADIDRLAGVIEDAEAASRAGDPYACSELDRQFHLTIFQASGLVALEPILTRCALHMHRYTFRYAASTRQQHESPVRSQHLAILDTLGHGQAEAAAQALRNHIEAVIGFWSPTLRRAMAESGCAG
jgi:DNA-binding GntR family transcriptional regulator